MSNARPESNAALDARIDAGLGRLFPIPAGLEGRLGALRPQSAERAPRLAWRRWPLAAAAAVVLALLGRLLVRPGDPGPGTLSPVPAGEPSPAFCSLVGPLEEELLDPSAVLTPDLARLYWTMDACQRASSASCEEEDRLAERLQATYGEDMELRPEAHGLLHGPFASPEWPTGTILTAFPENRTSVLVAERDSTLACCLRVDLPEESGLRLFTWRVGELVLTEITPLDEPRLLGWFE